LPLISSEMIFLIIERIIYGFFKNITDSNMKIVSFPFLSDFTCENRIVLPLDIQ
jgi:hypothetical protein